MKILALTILFIFMFFRIKGMQKVKRITMENH